MAYDEETAERVRGALGTTRGVVEKRMFGGIAFMLGGHMACGIVGSDLMLRLGPEAAGAALQAYEHEARELLRKYLASSLTPDDPSRMEAEKLLRKTGS